MLEGVSITFENIHGQSDAEPRLPILKPALCRISSFVISIIPLKGLANSWFCKIKIPQIKNEKIRSGHGRTIENRLSYGNKLMPSIILLLPQRTKIETRCTRKYALRPYNFSTAYTFESLTEAVETPMGARYTKTTMRRILIRKNDTRDAKSMSEMLPHFSYLDFTSVPWPKGHICSASIMIFLYFIKIKLKISGFFLQLTIHPI